MAMVRCDNGHFYPADKHTTCPHCGVQGLEIEPTRPLGGTPPGAVAGPAGGADGDGNADGGGGSSATTEADPVGESTERVDGDAVSGDGPEAASERAPNDASDRRTVGQLGRALGFEPVVGWLVCVEGPNRGHDYRLHAERNFVGRSAAMDVSIPDDDAISRERHAVLSYDPRQGIFRLAPGDGRRLTYLNGDAIDDATTLEDGDVIELGSTRLIFVPFCGDRFRWT